MLRAPIGIGRVEYSCQYRPPPHAREIMLRFLQARRYRQKLVREDATALVQRFGGHAYEEARRRIREQRSGKVTDANRPIGHWDQVRKLIARETNRSPLDTATRYLIPKLLPDIPPGGTEDIPPGADAERRARRT